jgi:hypothetical protein
VESCGPYKIVSETGSGDGWTSYLARGDGDEVLITVFADEAVARQVIELQQRAAAASPHVAPVLKSGRCEEGEWYATRAYPRNLAKLLEGRVELSQAWLLAVLLATSRGALAFKDACGRSHGGLQPHNILLSGTTNLKEAEIVIKDPAGGESSAGDLELRDLKAIGMVLYQLVRRREVEERSMILPLEVSPEWKGRFGKQADRWVSLCNRLLDPGLSLEQYNLEQLERELVALEPKAPVSRKQLVAAVVVVVCLGVASLVVGWFRNQASLEVTSNLPGATVTVSSEGKVLKTMVVQNAPVALKVKKGKSYHLDGKRDEFTASTDVLVAARKHEAPLQFRFARLSIEAVVEQNGTTTRLWSTNRFVLPGVEVREPITVEGYQSEPVTLTLRAGDTTNIVKVLRKAAPGDVRIEIEVLPVTARVEVYDAANKFVTGDSREVRPLLSPGRYKVLLRYEVATLTNQIDVLANQPRTDARKIRFTIPTGQLRLTAEEGATEVQASIWHGTNQVGVTGTSASKYWPTGTWTFRLEAPGYESTNVTVAVQTDAMVSKRQAIVPIVAIVDVSSDPVGVAVGTNQGQLTWKTPATFRFPPGTYTLYASNEDLGAISKPIAVARGQTNVTLEFAYGRVKLSANLPDARANHTLNPNFRPVDSIIYLPVGSNRLTAVYKALLTNTLDLTVSAANKQSPLAGKFEFQFGEVIFTNSLPGAEVFLLPQGRFFKIGDIRAGETLTHITPWEKQTYYYRAQFENGVRTNSRTVTVTSRGPYFVEADFKQPAGHKTSFGMELVWIDGLGYYVGKYEVTQAEFQSVMGTNPSRWKITPTNPVDSVTFQAATEFCQRLNASDKLIPEQHKDYRYSLPSFAQWRAFAGTAFSNASLAVLKGTNSLPVGSRPANEHQLHDVRGNLLEWTLEGEPVGNSYESPGLFRLKEIIPSRDYTDQKIGFRVILAPAQLARK